MILNNFWLQNIHFATEVFVGLVSFTIAWLYIDTWGLKKTTKAFLRALGFLLISVWSLLGAITIENEQVQVIEQILKLAGLLLVTISFAIDPVPIRPSGSESEEDSHKSAQNLILGVPIWLDVFKYAPVASVVLVLTTCGLLFVRVGKGLVKEWRLLFIGFILFLVSEIAGLGYVWSDSTNLAVSELVKMYGFVWYVEHGFKLIAFIVMGAWAWGFLRFRLFPQLFTTYVSIVFLVFVGTTISFATLLFRSVEQDQLAQLRINIQTVEYALDQLKDKAVLSARVVAESGAVVDALVAKDADRLYTVTNRLMFESKADFLATVDSGADVIARAEDRSRIGDNLQNDQVVAEAFRGQSLATVSVQEGVSAPAVIIRAGSPILSHDGKTIGVVVTGYILDSAFLDGVKKVTGLDITAYGGDVRSASTITLPGSTTRNTGLVETDKRVKKDVLEAGKTFVSSTNVLGTPYYSAYAPLENTDGKVVGMLSVGRRQIEVIDAINDTTRVTFVVAILLMLFSILPIYFLARYIYRHQQA